MSDKIHAICDDVSGAIFNFKERIGNAFTVDSKDIEALAEKPIDSEKVKEIALKLLPVIQSGEFINIFDLLELTPE